MGSSGTGKRGDSGSTPNGVNVQFSSFWEIANSNRRSIVSIKFENWPQRQHSSEFLGNPEPVEIRIAGTRKDDGEPYVPVEKNFRASFGPQAKANSPEMKNKCL